MDFAVARGEGGRLAPKLIELQAFPTLYAFQVAQCEELARSCARIRQRLGWFLSGLDAASYRKVVGDAILAGLPPENVVLLDLDPPQQKTAIDFAFTEQFWGVRAVDPSEIEKRGPRALVHARRQADAHPAHLQPAHLRRARGDGDGEASASTSASRSTSRGPATRTGTSAGASTRCPSCVTRRVPEAIFLSDLDSLAEGPRRSWVLKPLFSFAGSGVKVDVTPARTSRPCRAEQRAHTLLMRKVDYAPGDRDDRRAILQGRGARHVRVERTASPSPSRRSRASRRAR